MKRNLWPGIVIAIVLICLGMMGGCQQAPKRSLEASYIVPPRVVGDVSSIRYMTIATPRVSLTGNYGKGSQLAPVFVNCLNQRLISGIYKERFFNVQDEIHGNTKGLQHLDKTMAKGHGYSIKPARMMNRAEIATRATISLTRTRGQDRMVTPLASIPYDVQYSDDGVPYSVPDYDAQVIQEHVSLVPFVQIVAKGNLQVEVRDAHKQLVYAKEFKDLTFVRKIGGENPVEALPTVLEMASSLFDAPIAQVVRDISPHKVNRTLYVNEEGDPTAVALIKATAFSEAYKRLSQVLEEHSAHYQQKIAGIKEDFSRQREKIRMGVEDPREQEILLDELGTQEKTALVDAGRFRSPDLENMAIVCEAMGITNEALDMYARAVDADPDNSQAASSLTRVNKLASKALSLQDQIPGRYQEEENKER
jgi:hypothetical protein